MTSIMSDAAILRYMGGYILNSGDCIADLKSRLSTPFADYYTVISTFEDLINDIAFVFETDTIDRDFCDDTELSMYCHLSRLKKELNNGDLKMLVSDLYEYNKTVLKQLENDQLFETCYNFHRINEVFAAYLRWLVHQTT